MTVSLKHQFVSNVSDSPDATLVQPSNWNAEHTLTANADSLLGAVTTGNVTEITCTSAGRALLDDVDASAQRTTLGLGTISTQNANNVSITGGSITGITDLAVADGGTGASDAATARTNLGIGTIATQNANNVSITGGSITGITDLAVADGGTGASDAATARTNLGIGTMGTQNANAVSITGGTIVANASGISIRDADASNVMTIAVGSNLTANTTLTLTTGATTNRTLDISATNVTISTAGAALIDDADAATQRTTLGLGTIATQNANNVSITGGSVTGITDLAVADGGTGASTAAGAATNLGLGTGDSPQFAAVNIGNATDTTITRVSAGVIAVEGKPVVMTTGGQTIEHAAGTVSAPSITTTGDTNTGIYFPAADTTAITTGGAERMRIGTSGQLGIGGANYGASGQLLTSGGASAAPSWTTVQGVTATTGSAAYYGARAWVNFNGTGTVSIRTSVNVSSITDNGTGDYSVNFTTAMADADYCACMNGSQTGGTAMTRRHSTGGAPTASAFRFSSCNSNNNGQVDDAFCYVAIYR